MLAEVSRERGKQYFGKGQLFEAMEEFNNCLALAEIGTNEMGLAFANRSACYVRMNMPMNAMTDIDLAKAANYPPQLMHKLNDRYQKCFLRLTTETFQPAIFRVRDLRLSFNEHDKFEGVADCLKIQRNMAYGRHIITKCDLQIGQIVLHEKPYSIVPNQSSMSYKNRCTHCFELFKNFITCNQCGAYFCSSEGCLEMSYHKHICNIPYSGPKHTFDLVLQVLFEINDAYKGVNQLLNAIESLRKGNYYMADLTGDQQKAFCSIFQMNHNHEKQSDEQMQSLLQASACAYQRIMHIANFNRKFVTKKHRRFLKHLILHLFHIAKYAIDLYDYRQEGSGDDGITKNHTFQMFGSGIYPIGSYISHSCNPNVLCYASCFSYMVCQVIRPIKKGEQLFRS
ncbi:uncharacterized protein LOC129565579 [Sitodiplosis mosellana]|uniref:uncharacterized protein LOC129565579 n=1 Tax=Sitodiplosis mosellana TaxID=263140 RepID=UPI002443A5CE|nr:uncharacterized protein LOC129565579 [Sitodiplosis mosellana]